jgi:arginine N-succinyltransferase
MAFLLRSVREDDYQDLRRLGRELNTVNLPSSPRELKGMIGRSLASFAGKHLRTPDRAQFLFVLEDLARKKVVGTSKIFARHGTLARPHVYFQVIREKVRSQSLHVDFFRTAYRLRQDPKGYTEIGGLVLDREYRRHREQLGKQLSFVRFIFMKAHPTWFRRRVIAELLPPLGPGQQSSLYEFYGHRLTRLPYRKADRLSFKNKEFILKLFPRADLYHDILPPEVQEDMGKAGSGSEAARYLLQKIGFHFADQVDPFDGGPYFTAKKNRIVVYQKTRALNFAGIHQGKGRGSFQVLWEKRGEVFGILRSGRASGKKFYFTPRGDSAFQPKLGQKLWVYRWS